MTTEPTPSLLQAIPSTWQRQLERIMDDAIAVVRTAAINERTASDQDLADALRLVAQVATELRILNDPDHLPF